VVRAMIDRPALAKAMKLRPDQAITLSQSVGYPKKRGVIMGPEAPTGAV